MFTTKRMPFRIAAPHAWRAILLFALYSFSICALYTWASWTMLALPFIPIAILGTVIMVYIAIKANFSYRRLMDARSVWVNLVNASRSWGILVVDYINGTGPAGGLQTNTLYDTKQILVYRHIAYLNALRVQLQSCPFWQTDSSTSMNSGETQQAFNQGQLDKELSLFLHDDEVEFFVTCHNPATQIIKRQSKQLKELHTSGLLSDYHHVDMERLLMELYTHQGAAERLKMMTFPKKYTYFTNMFLAVFIAVLPFGLLAGMATISSWHVWLTLPVYTVIAWLIYVVEMSEDANESPFDNSLNDPPMTAFCRNVEIDLREMLGETELPQLICAIDSALTQS